MRDEVAVEAEANREFEERLGGAVLVGGIERWEVHEEVKRLNHKVATALHEAMGIHFDVRLFVPGTLPLSEGESGSRCRSTSIAAMRYNPLLLGPCCKKRESLMAVLKKTRNTAREHMHNKK